MIVKLSPGYINLHPIKKTQDFFQFLYYYVLPITDGFYFYLQTLVYNSVFTNSLICTIDMTNKRQADHLMHGNNKFKLNHL